MKVALPASWQAALQHELQKPYFHDLSAFVTEERKTQTIYPPESEVFNAFHYTPLDQVKVVLLGQDPYHGANQAHGLCFSVRPGVALPASLRNMMKELQADKGCPIPKNGSLIPWAEQGMLLLNAVLTVRAGEPNSHKNQGWEKFTDAAIRAVNEQEKPVVFALWGGFAQKKEKLIDATRHRIVKTAHPSPLSAKKFMGSKPFSAIDAALVELGHEPLNWCLPAS